MESQGEKNRYDRETPDIGASIFAGAIICLAIYGGYKLFQREMNETRAIEGRVDKELLDKIVDQELKS